MAMQVAQVLRLIARSGRGRTPGVAAGGPAWRQTVPACSSATQLLNQCGFSAGPDDTEAVKSAEKLLELMSSSPAMQQMMLAGLPASIRNNPEMLKAMLNDPGVKKKMVEMISKQGMKFPSHVLEKMNSSHMDEVMVRLRRVGIEPMDIPGKLMSYPGLFKQLQEPRIMQAFLETSEDPSAASKYGPDVMDVVRKAQDILRTKSTPQDNSQAKDATIVSSISSGSPASSPTQPPPPADSPIITPPPPSGTPNPTPASSPADQVPGGSPIPFMHLLMQDPSLAAKLQNPRIQKALEEISKSPWKTIKYVMDKEVMEVFKVLNDMLKNQGAKK